MFLGFILCITCATGYNMFESDAIIYTAHIGLGLTCAFNILYHAIGRLRHKTSHSGGKRRTTRPH